MLVLLMLGLRLGWGAYADRRLAGQIEMIRARGEPGSLAEVKFEAVSDSENAWLLLMRASGAHVAGMESPGNSNLECRDYPPYPAAWNRLAEASEKAHGQVFALARQARILLAMVREEKAFADTERVAVDVDPISLL